METGEIADLIVEAARQIVLPRFRALEAGQIMEKKPGDYVTVADQETEAYLTQRLQAAYPTAVILGEEASVEDPAIVTAFNTADHGWVMDPIDGTKNFVNGSAEFAVMVAETRGGVTVRSWIWQPIHERMYISERGTGAWCNGQPLEMVPRHNPYRGVADRQWVGDTMGGVAAPITLQAMCAGTDYPLLATGTHDFIVYRGQHAWDHLPGAALIAEMGGVSRTYEQQDYAPGVRGGYLLVARDEATWNELREGAPAPR